MSADAAEERERLLAGWERAAEGWGVHADTVRDEAMPVSAWLIEALALQPGQTVLELAAGPGDTGFMAAELIRPGGRLICSDGADAMLDVARERARGLALDGVAVEFRHLQLEWIDLPAASVDRALCRWGVMLVLDPEAAVREARRVLRPGGRYALAVWDAIAANPWATVSGRALVDLGHAEPPSPGAPGPFALGDADRVRALLEGAGFQDIVLEPLAVDRRYPTFDAYLATQLGLSRVFADAYRALGDSEQARIRERMTELAEPYTADDGSLLLPGRTLVAAADA